MAGYSVVRLLAPARRAGPGFWFGLALIGIALGCSPVFTALGLIGANSPDSAGDTSGPWPVLSVGCSILALALPGALLLFAGRPRRGL